MQVYFANLNKKIGTIHSLNFPFFFYPNFFFVKVYKKVLGKRLLSFSQIERFGFPITAKTANVRKVVRVVGIKLIIMD